MWHISTGIVHWWKHCPSAQVDRQGTRDDFDAWWRKPIRAKLDQAQLPYTDKDGTISLLEKLMNKGQPDQKLQGLRTVQYLRSKTKGHVGGSEAEGLAQQALMEHETFGNHFRHVCQLLADDLETVERLFR